MNHAVELVVFELNAGVSEDEFLAAVAQTERDLRQLSGYLDRELSRTEGGRWIDIVHWASLDDAHRAAEQIMTLPSGQLMGSMINFETIQMLHSLPRYVDRD